jgi:hypothetical protein
LSTGLLSGSLHRHALGEISGLVHIAAARNGCSKFLGGRERQAAFAVEKFLQPPVAGTAPTPDDAGRDELAAFAAGATAFEPVFPTD